MSESRNLMDDFKDMQVKLDQRVLSGYNKNGKIQYFGICNHGCFWTIVPGGDQKITPPCVFGKADLCEFQAEQEAESHETDLHFRTCRDSLKDVTEYRKMDNSTGG